MTFAIFHGAANLDVISRCVDTPVAGASNVAATVQFAGGAAFNVASIFAKLGGEAMLATALANDASGAFLGRVAVERGLDIHSVSCERTGAYTAICGPDGALIMAASDMAGIEEAELATVEGATGWHFIDANMSEHEINRLAGEARGPVALASVSVAKVTRLIPALREADLLFTNTAEWHALCGGDLAAFRKISRADVVISDGASGVTVVQQDTVTIIEVPEVGSIVDVVGAGDALAGGTLFALAREWPLIRAVEQGIAAAQTVLQFAGPYPGTLEPMH